MIKYKVVLILFMDLGTISDNKINFGLEMKWMTITKW
jgi:hypothetical protein